MKKFLVVGAGGFIGGHLIKRLLDEGNIIRGVDLKPFDLWFQKFENVDNHSLDKGCVIKMARLVVTNR